MYHWLRFYVPLDTKLVISEMFPKPISWLGMEKKQNLTQQNHVMAAQPKIGGALCKNSVIPFLVLCCKVWLTPAAGVLRSNAANIREQKIWTQSEFARDNIPSAGKSRQKCI